MADHVSPTLSTFDSSSSEVDRALAAEREIASALSRNATQMWDHYRREALSGRVLEKIYQLTSEGGAVVIKTGSNEEEGGHCEPLSLEASFQQPTERAQTHQPQLLEMSAQKKHHLERTCEDDEEEQDTEREVTKKVEVEMDQKEAERMQEPEEGRMEEKEGEPSLAIGLVFVSQNASIEKQGDMSSSSEDDFQTPPSSPTSFSTSPFPRLIEDDAVDDGNGKSLCEHGPQPQVQEGSTSQTHSFVGTDETDAFPATVYSQSDDTSAHYQGVDCGVNTNLPEVTDQASNTPIVEVCQQATNTDRTETRQNCTNTEIEMEDKMLGTDRVETSEEGTIVEPPMEEKAVNTELSAFELLKRVHSVEKLERLEMESKLMAAELNEEKSKRMVGDSLVQMLQSEIVELRQSNATETTSRLRLENELTSIKAELGTSQMEVKEREKRITELEESLQGTMHLVNKMEQQSAVLNKGGIDYLLVAKVAEGQAQEAKQQMIVLQTELIHSQSEVKRLLDRIEELSQDRREMVSSRVHTQLLKLSDERAEAAEARAKELESQVMSLKSSVATRTTTGGTTSPTYANLHGSSTSPVPSPYSTFDPFRTSTSSSYLSSMGTGPFSYTGSSMTSSIKPGSYGYSGLSASSLGSYSSGGSGLELFGSVGTAGLSSAKTAGGGLGLYDPSSGLGSASSHLYPLSAKESLGTVDVEPAKEPTKDPPYAAHGAIGASPPFSSLPDTTHLKGSSEPSNFLRNLPDLASMKQPPVADKKPQADTEGSGSTSLFPPSNADSDSSDWSSSGEEDSGTGKSGMSEELRPSTHMNLRSKWEWWSQQHSGSPQSQLSGPVTQPLPVATGKKPCPPVAPKPKLTKRVSWDRGIFNEPPISFEQPPTQPPLKVLSKPTGPRGRRLPSRFYDYQAPSQQDLVVNLPLFD